MSEMVEKVASAIAGAADEGEFQIFAKDARAMARAAIAAMREPSKEMVQAATTDQGLLAQAFWDAMVRSALDETEGAAS